MKNKKNNKIKIKSTSFSPLEYFKYSCLSQIRQVKSI